MAFDRPGAGGLDYRTCRYGTSKLLFRGPRHRLVPPYALFVGGTDTYGRFVPRPFPDLVSDLVGAPTGGAAPLPCINMGCAHAGPDAFAEDETVRAALARADVAVIEVMGAHALSTSFFRVHPRRNDRFIAAEPALRELFPEIDFTEFAFTRHMLGALEAADPRRFARVAAALRAAWLAQMGRLVAEARATLLLWVADGPPPARAASVLEGRAPPLVDADMLAQVARGAAGVIEVRPSVQARAAGTAGMVFSELEASAAACVAGPAIHREVAAAVAPALARVAGGEAGAGSVPESGSAPALA